MADPKQKAEIFELNNGTLRALITNFGCTITSLSVPDKDGIFCISKPPIYSNHLQYLYLFLLYHCGNYDDLLDFTLIFSKENWLM